MSLPCPWPPAKAGAPIPITATRAAETPAIRAMFRMSEPFLRDIPEHRRGLKLPEKPLVDRFSLWAFILSCRHSSHTNESSLDRISENSNKDSQHIIRHYCDTSHNYVYPSSEVGTL